MIPESWYEPLPGAPHFSLAELTRSDTAETYHLDNTPNQRQQERLIELARRVLEPLRMRFGPIKVLSGFRSAELNWFVSTSRTSRHCQGEAADLQPVDSRIPLLDLLAHAHQNLPVGEVIAEYFPDGWVHVSLARPGEKPRLMVKEKGSPIRPTDLNRLAERYSSS